MSGQKSDLCSLDIDIGPCFTGAWVMGRHIGDTMDTVRCQYNLHTRTVMMMTPSWPDNVSYIDICGV